MTQTAPAPRLLLEGSEAIADATRRGLLGGAG